MRMDLEQIKHCNTSEEKHNYYLSQCSEPDLAHYFSSAQHPDQTGINDHQLPGGKGKGFACGSFMTDTVCTTLCHLLWKIFLPVGVVTGWIFPPLFSFYKVRRVGDGQGWRISCCGCWIIDCSLTLIELPSFCTANEVTWGLYENYCSVICWSKNNHTNTGIHNIAWYNF